MTLQKLKKEIFRTYTRQKKKKKKKREHGKKIFLLKSILVMDADKHTFIKIDHLKKKEYHNCGNKGHKFSRGARGVMVIVVGNGHADTSSNPGRDWLHFT